MVDEKALLKELVQKANGTCSEVVDENIGVAHRLGVDISSSTIDEAIKALTVLKAGGLQEKDKMPVQYLIWALNVQRLLGEDIQYDIERLPSSPLLQLYYAGLYRGLLGGAQELLEGKGFDPLARDISNKVLRPGKVKGGENSRQVCPGIKLAVKREVSQHPTYSAQRIWNIFDKYSSSTPYKFEDGSDEYRIYTDGDKKRIYAEDDEGNLLYHRAYDTFRGFVGEAKEPPEK